jgi:ABC-type Mn2+/Zn2+ transport system permease subunit
VIHDFIESWELFANSYIAGWLIAAMLAMLGVIIVARDQVFLGAAISQASMLGVATALVAGAWLGLEAGEAEAHHGVPALFAVTFAIAATLLTLRRTGPGRESHEAMTGWVFLIASSLAVLLVANSPHGLKEVERLLASKLIHPSELDLLLFGIGAITTTVALCSFHKRLMLIVMDRATAAALGVRVRAWDTALAVWLGLAIGLSLHVAGLLYVFGCLVVPAMIARNLCRRMAPMFWVSPLIALVGVSIGFIWANHADYPFAQAAVATLATLMVPAWLVRRMRSAGRGGPVG